MSAAMIALRFLGGNWRWLAPTLLLALVAAWGARMDHLRAYYHGALDDAAVALTDALGSKVKSSQIVPAVNRIASDRDQFMRERNNARAVVDQQSAGITALHIETERLAKLSAQDRIYAEAMIKQRNVWIERARLAETRTERRSAEQELEECDAVLNALFDAGF